MRSTLVPGIDPSNGRIALTHGRIVLQNQVLADRALVIEGGKILGLSEYASLGSDVEQFDVSGRLITPGLIDLHTHGALGHTFNEPTADAFEAITQENARR